MMPDRRGGVSLIEVSESCNLPFFRFAAGSVLTSHGRFRINPAPTNLRNHQTNQEHRMRGVTLKKGEPVDRALKRLKTKLDAEGILEEMRRRRAFETPTERKQRKLRSASKRNKIRWRYSNAPAVDRSETAE
jgi:small subunit ribosomal protein S21